MARRTTGALVSVFVTALLSAFFLYFIRPALVDLGRPSLASGFDLQSYFLPRFVYGSKTLLGGQVPLWNPFEFGGLPLLATAQPSVFYPPKILLYGLLPRESAHWAFLVSHYILMAVGMGWFLRDRGTGGVGTFVGVVLWVFSAPALSSNYHPPRIANLVWMPLMFALSGRARLRDSRAIAWLALVVAVDLSAGYPEFPLDTAVLIGVHALGSWAFCDWAPPWKTLPYIAGAFVVGGVTASAQLLPLAELASLSSRDTLVAPGSFSFPAAVGPGLLLLTVPGLFGFTLLGLFAPKSRPAVLGFAMCLLIGNGGWRILRLIPGFSFIRFPLVWVYLSTFYFAWLAALGADALGRSDVPPARARKFAWTLGASGLLFLAFYLFGWHWLGKSADELTTRLSLSVGTPSGAVVGIAGTVALTVLAMVLARTRHRPPPAVWMAVISVLVIAHLCAFPFGAKSSPFGPPTKVGRVARFAEYAGQLHGRALSPDDILYGYEVADHVPSPLGVEQSFLPWRYRQVVSRLGFISMFGRIDWSAVDRAKGYLDAMDVELVVAPAYVSDNLVAHGLREVGRAEDASFLANPGRMGHAWVNYAALHFEADEDALDAFVGRRFDPHREVLLEERTEHAFPRPGPSTLLATQPLSETRTSSVSVAWDVELPQPGVFVVSETAYPGWEATVDGQHVRWMRANYVLRGVELGAGKHRVSFEYRPFSFRMGGFMSVLGLLCIALTFAWRGIASRFAVSRPSAANPL